jgi:predicted nucleic acid-binding protein
VLDVLLDREPFAEPAADLLSRAEAGEIAGCLCATTITTIHYLASKVVGDKESLLAVRKLLSIFEVAPVNRPVLEAALDSRLADFEDAVLYEAARQVSAQAIVTRDPADFKKSALPVYSPRELLQALLVRGSSPFAP